MTTFHLADRPPVSAAIAAAASCSTLSELYRAIEGYRGHELAFLRPYTPAQTVSEPHPMMIISEKPEAEDLQTGKPFSGAYGRLMREALAVNGIDPDDLHITYAVHWAPEGETAPNKTMIAASRPFLFREIELVQPRAILATGKCVVEALSLYKGPITPFTGQTMRWEHAGSKQDFYVCFHPAYPLRLPAQIPDFFAQVRGFFEQYGRPEKGVLANAA